jgi:HD-like signal output (HDOD) protein
VKNRCELTARDVDELHARIRRRLGDTSVPTLPHVAMEVIRLVGDQNSSIQQFEETIQADQALTGRVLRVANTAHFAQEKEVTTLRRATVLIGLQRIKAIALGFHLGAAVDDRTLERHKSMWTVSLYRGWLALRLAEKLRSDVAGEAFIISFMGDVGIPLMSRLVGDGYEPVVGQWEAPGAMFLREYNELPLTHVDVAAVLCRLWKLPESLALPICLHHNPAPPADPSDPGSVRRAIAYAVGSMHLTPSDFDGNRLPDIRKARGVMHRLLRLTPDELGACAKEAIQDFDATRDLFRHLIDGKVDLESVMAQAGAHLCESAEPDLQRKTAPTKRVPIARLGAAQLRIEAEPAAGGRVRLLVMGEAGAHLLSEEVEPAALTQERLREMLASPDARDEELERVVNAVRRLAA